MKKKTQWRHMDLVLATVDVILCELPTILSSLCTRTHDFCAADCRQSCLL